MAIQANRPSACTRIAAWCLLVALAPAYVFAQQPIVPLQLGFSDPGARSMGFGGAFVALADDATAAFANPAGLTQLLKPEVSLEGRRWMYSTPFTEAGRVEGYPSGIGIDDLAGLRTARSEAELNGLSFLSFVFPEGNWSFALFRHQFANLEFSGETQGLFGGGSDCCQIRFVDQRATSRLDMVSYGFSVAHRIGEDLDLGLGLVYYDATLNATVTQFLTDDDSLESIFGPNSYLPERSLLSQRDFFDDVDRTLTASFLWRLSESWRIGGVYRQGPKTGFRIEVRAGQAVDYGVPPGALLSEGSGGPIKFPDVYGLGFAYRDPDGRLTISFQWDRVEYSSIPASVGVDDQTISDADELHLGAEYLFLGSTVIVAVRLGTWLDPDHQMRATTDDPFVRALLPRRRDDVHYAAGLGVATSNFQVDVGVDLADLLDTVSLSVIYSF